MKKFIHIYMCTETICDVCVCVCMCEFKEETKIYAIRCISIKGIDIDSDGAVRVFRIHVIHIFEISCQLVFISKCEVLMNSKERPHSHFHQNSRNQENRWDLLRISISNGWCGHPKSADIVIEIHVTNYFFFNLIKIRFANFARFLSLSHSVALKT